VSIATIFAQDFHGIHILLSGTASSGFFCCPRVIGISVIVRLLDEGIIEGMGLGKCVSIAFFGPRLPMALKFGRKLSILALSCWLNSLLRNHWFQRFIIYIVLLSSITIDYHFYTRFEIENR